jgi:hypothetical protein
MHRGQQRALMNLHPIYALVIASLMVPAVALALMADRALAAEPQMPESFQGTWCYNERPIPTGVATAAAIRTILEQMRHSPNCGIKPDHPGPDPQIEIEITATEVKAIGAFADHTRLEPIPAFPLSCVVRRVTKFDVCPWGMIYKNRERARALRNFQIVGTRLSHRAPMRSHPHAVGDDRDRLADRKGIRQRGRCAPQLSVAR